MRFLGIDYGRKRIGLALSDATGLLARPWKTVAREGNDVQVAAMLSREVQALCADADGLAAVVIGWPRHLDGAPHDLASTIGRIGDALRARVTVPVVFQDERLTSHEADEMLKARERDWRKRKGRLDETAAAILLQDYLDAQARSTTATDVSRSGDA